MINGNDVINLIMVSGDDIIDILLNYVKFVELQPLACALPLPFCGDDVD